MIKILFYTKLSAKGRVAGRTSAVYNTEDFEEAYRMHAAAVAAGTVTQVKVGGWATVR